MFKLLLATSVSVFSFVSASVAQMQCDIPYQGSWLLETGQTTTIGGPGGGPQSGKFELAVDDCGKSIVATGMGSSETGLTKTFYREGDKFRWSTVYRGFPITIDLEMLDPGRMTANWKFAGGMALAPGVLTYQSSGALALRDPRCDCQTFKDQLKEAIWSNESFIATYSQLSERPDGLDPSLPWQSDVSEGLVDLQAGLDVSRSEAVEILNGMPGGRSRTLKNNVNTEIQSRQEAKSSSDGQSDSAGGSDGGSVSSDAYTDAGTCKIELTQPAKGCAADILDEATNAHEMVHQIACLAQKEVQKAWNFLDGGEEPSSYKYISDQPAYLADEEIRAYKASTDYIRQTYAQMCGKPLN